MRALLLSTVLAGLLCAAAAPSPKIVSINIDSVVHPVTEEILTHAIERATQEQAAAVLIRLDTPGGMLESTRKIVEQMMASPVPVITFVTPGGRAASAGFFILLAGDIAAMASGTHTGAASPVLLGQQMDPVMRRKVESDSSAAMRTIAARRGRNSEAAQAAITEARSFTDKEALDAKLVDLIAANESDLWRLLDNREITRPNGTKLTLHTANAQVVPYQLSVREKAVYSIADPNLAFALLVLGGLLLYVEFTTPGVIAPGVFGGILVLLGLMSLSVLPISWAGVALLILAVVLFILEAKIMSHGVLGIGGVIAMVLGATLLVEGPPEMRIRLQTALAVGIGFGLVTLLLISLVVKVRRRPVTTGAGGMLLETGVAYTELNPTGKVFIHGEYWNAQAGQPIAQGLPVRVTAIDGLCLKVEEIKQ